MRRSNLQWWLALAAALLSASFGTSRPPRVMLKVRLWGHSGITLVFDNPVGGGDVYRANLALPADGLLSVTTEFPADTRPLDSWM